MNKDNKIIKKLAKIKKRKKIKKNDFYSESYKDLYRNNLNIIYFLIVFYLI